ncbi:MAG: hypothetical protein AB1714_10455 [Acidobacteriota bacterium]
MIARLKNIEDRPAIALLAAVSLFILCWQGTILWTKHLDKGDLVASDGKFYYVYLPSILFDHDLDFENDYELIGARRFEGETALTREGYVTNLFSVGPAILWSPFFLLAHAVTKVGNVFGAGWPADGYGHQYMAFVVLGNCLYGCAGLFLLYLTLRRRFEMFVSASSALVAALGTTMIFYFGDRAFFPSAAQFFAISFLLYGSLFRDSREVLGSPVRLGIALGLVVLVKATDVVFGIVPLAASLPHVLESIRRREWRFVRQAMVVLVIVLAINVPKIIVKQTLHPWGDPRLRTGFLHPLQPFVMEQLFSTRRGLLTWSPVLWIAAAGLLPLARRNRRELLVVLLVMAAVLYVNGVSGDWWGGRSPGSRRLTSLLPLLAYPLACAIGWMTRCGRVPVCLLLMLFGVDNYLMYRVFVEDPVFRRTTVSFVDVCTRKARVLIDAVGYPASFPATLWIAHRYGISTTQAELVWGWYLDTDIDALDFGEDARFYLGRGWAERAGEENGVTYRRTVGPSATILVGRLGSRVAMASIDRVVIRGRMEGVREAAPAVTLNGVVLVPESPLTWAQDWRETAFHIDPALWKAGINEIGLEISSKGRRQMFSVDRVRFPKAGAPEGGNPPSPADSAD